MSTVEDRLRALGVEAGDAPELGAVLDRGERLQRHRRRVHRAVVAAVAVVTLVAVSWSAHAIGLRGVGEPGTLGQAGVQPSDDRRHPSVSDPIFDGLPPALVAEVLSNPAAQANIDMPISPADRDSLWQGMVLNFMLCRQEFDIYKEWVTTGPRPQALPAPPRPTTPLSSYSALLTFHRYLQSLVDSQDPARMRTDLLADAGCGKWIPVTPGDASGPTIADVVRRMGVR